MIRFLLSKLSYGCLVLVGVVVVVFFLFNLSPGDPVRNLVGENASEQTINNMRRKFDLDLPLGKRFLLYVNSLSPVSIHSTQNKESRAYFEPTEMSGIRCFSLSGDLALYLKWPYLKRSFITDKSVSSILAEVLPGTIALAAVSIMLAMIIGMIMGIIAALEKDSFFDRLMLFLAALGMAGPSFFVAIIVAWIGAILWREKIDVSWLMIAGVVMIIPMLLLLHYSKLKIKTSKAKAIGYWLVTLVGLQLMVMFVFSRDSIIRSTIGLPGTGLNMTGSLYSVDVWKGQYLDLRNMILPVITLMIRPLSVIVQLMRSSLIDVMHQDFIRTARAKGISEYRVVVGHALRNALNPVITAVSGWFASLLAGAIFVEFVFGWKGLGQQMFTAIENQDLPVVMGGVIVIAFFFVIINILVDMIYGWIDPRVR
jgi:peptide/nickel transport system permease protein